MSCIPRCKCIESERIFGLNEVREADDELLRLFLAVRLSKRICCDDAICQRCRCQFIHWKEKLEVDFDIFDCFDRWNVESVNIDDNSIRNWIFLLLIVCI